MNTGEGFFFGSEMRRLLKTFRDANGGRFGICDFCGRSCAYWSVEFYEALRKTGVDTLPDLYQEFLVRHPEVRFLVDGSKTIPASQEAPPDYIIVPTKHPLRLVASHIYNKRERFKIQSDQLEQAGVELERSIVNGLQPIRVMLKSILNKYKATLASCRGAFIFRSDEAHRDGFRIFRDLEHHLGVPQRTFDPDAFTKKPSHTIGGNRAPVWITKDAHGQTTPNTPRKDYYTSSSSMGDWKLDNKYELLIRPSTLTVIRSIPAYSMLCELLSYGSTPG